jgi:NAD(P)H-dependent FMN reductase
MAQLLIPVIYGSVRRERQGIRAARYIARALQARGANAVLVDPLEYKLPLLDLMYKEYPPGEAPEVLEKLATLFRAADGFVVVSGEYNHGVPPALSNLLDHFLEEYFWRPAGIVCYSGGRFSGVRAAVQLRSMLAEMGMVTIPTELPFGQVQHAFDENGVPTDAKTDTFAAAFFEEFEWYVNALAVARAGGTPT